MTRVNVRALKDRLSEYLDRVAKGESVEVVRRGKPVAWLSPAENKALEAARKMRELEIEGIVTPPRKTGPWSKLPPAKIRGGKTAAEMILEDRRARF